jgi:hypothetical protein
MSDNATCCLLLVFMGFKAWDPTANVPSLAFAWPEVAAEVASGSVAGSKVLECLECLECLARVDAKSVSQVVQRSLGFAVGLVAGLVVGLLDLGQPVLVLPLSVESSRREVWEGWDLRLTLYCSFLNSNKSKFNFNFTCLVWTME